jgi:hypothetical protein
VAEPTGPEAGAQAVWALGVEITCRVYKPRDPRKTSLCGLLDSLYERVKGVWEERFERSCGFWRGLMDEVVASYLACGLGQRRGRSSTTMLECS